MKLNYSLSMWNYEAYTVPAMFGEAIADARRSGYGVEVWPSWKEEGNLFAPEKRARLVDLLQDIPSSLHGGPVRTLDEHKTQIQAAKDTRSPVIVVHADSLSTDGQTINPGMTAEVVAFARDSGVTIALENGTGSVGLDDLLRAADAVPDLKFCLDIGHVYVAHDRSLSDYLQLLGSKIAHLHLQDVYMVPSAKRAKSDSHRAPGQCDIPFRDWRLLLSTLTKIGYSGFAVLEVRPFDPAEIASQSTEFLDSIG